MFFGALERTALVVQVLVEQWERVGVQLAASVAERQQPLRDASGERQETHWHSAATTLEEEVNRVNCSSAPSHDSDYSNSALAAHEVRIHKKGEAVPQKKRCKAMGPANSNGLTIEVWKH